LRVYGYYYAIMQVTIKWNILSLGEWSSYFSNIRRSNLLQDYSYAKAVAPLYGQRPKWGLIDIDGQPAGLCQVMEASMLWGAVHAVMLDRGPLWFDGYGDQDHILAFAAEMQRLYPRRLGRKRRFLPECTGSDAFTQAMSEMGWARQGDDLYKTLWIDVTQDQETLRAALRKSWRQSLVKAEKSAMSISWDVTPELVGLNLKRYELDKIDKGYSGPDVKVLRSLCSVYAAEKKILLATAFLDKKPIAGILILCHGSSATYQMGWSDQKGRHVCAHHRLLWEATLKLKATGFSDFDLGGINDTDAKTVKTFKSGMGAQAVQLAGMYG